MGNRVSGVLPRQIVLIALISRWYAAPTALNDIGGLRETEGLQSKYIGWMNSADAGCLVAGPEAIAGCGAGAQKRGRPGS